MKQFIKEVARGKRGSKDLSYEEAELAANEIIQGNATDAQLSAFLIAQRLKVESPEELLAFVKQFSDHTTKLSLSSKLKKEIVDFAGAYTGRNSFAATIPVSILLSEQGLPVFLHSSDSLPPKYGTALKEIVRKLGISHEQNADELKTSIEKNNIGFASAEVFNPTLSEIRKVREEIGVRTLFNTVEKLLNISNAKSIMLGAYHKTAINKIIPIFKGLDFDQVFIVQGVEGSEDLPVYRNSFVYKINGDEAESLIVSPKEYGFNFGKDEVNEKLSLDEQVQIIEKVLSGVQAEEISAYRSQVLFNTGIRSYLFGLTDSIEDGINKAEQQLNDGIGTKQLEKWRNSTTNSIVKS